MPHYHPKTGEMLLCNHCPENKPVKYFIAGLYPICKKCSIKYLHASGASVFEKLCNMNDENGYNKHLLSKAESLG